MSKSRLPNSGLLAFAAACLLGCGDTRDVGVLKLDGVHSILACNSTTGSLAYLGPSLERSMDLAVLDVNEGGGVLGKPLQLIKANDHSLASGIEEARFYYERYRPTIVGIAGATLDELSRKLLAEIASADVKYGDKIPIISPASSSPEFIELLDRSNIFFRTVISSYHEGTTLARKAGALGYARGAIVAFRDPTSVRLADAFQRTFASLGGGKTTEVIFYDDVQQAAVTAAVAKVSPAKHQFILFLAQGSVDGKVALNEWSAKLPQLPLLFSSALVSSDFFASLDQRTLSALDAVSVNGVAPSSDPS
ncbi:MAG TPA: ABC transporter substrate-binding protein, partial [Myxococcaceae bacterium]|nr:ABC transporter substrate-binding protein [Myxococcaceae bacterium]